jgi:hypothetical protein
LALVLAGCSDAAAPVPVAPEPVAPACATGELTLEDGGCLPPGVPADECGDGFANDGEGGCIAILPDQPCVPGSMAIPGETVCRPVAPCGSGRWGDVVLEAGTTFVDASYLAADADGTEQKPFPDVQQALSAAPPGGLVAIAAGSYTGQFDVQKPVRLWGKCPAEVELRNDSSIAGYTIFFSPNGSGSSIRGVAVAGALAGIAGLASDVLIEQVWLHDLGYRGVHFFNDAGPASFTVRDSLIEDAADLGVFAWGANVTVERSVIRDIAFDTNGFGRGIGVTVDTDGPEPVRSTLTVRQSVVERVHDTGILIAGSDAHIHDVYIADTQPGAQGIFGFAISIDYEDVTDDRSSVIIERVVMDRNQEAGLQVVGSDATLSRLTIRNTISAPQSGMFGRGMNVQARLGQGAVMTLERSLIASNQDVGIYVANSQASVMTTWVRDTAPRQLDGFGGRGISVVRAEPDQPPTLIEISDTLVEHCASTGILVSGADGSMHNVAVRDVLPDAIEGIHGLGLTIQRQFNVDLVPFSLIDIEVERTSQGGIMVTDTAASMTNVTVKDVAALGTGEFGDGIIVNQFNLPADVTVTGSHIESAARDGISIFSATLTLADTTLECIPIPLAAETLDQPPNFTDAGGNQCGCDGSETICRATSTMLDPPSPLEPDSDSM